MHIATVAKSQRSVMSQNDSKVDGSNILTLKVVIVADQNNMAHGQTLMTDQTKYASIVEKNSLPTKISFLEPPWFRAFVCYLAQRTFLLKSYNCNVMSSVIFLLSGFPQKLNLTCAWWWLILKGFVYQFSHTDEIEIKTSTVNRWVLALIKDCNSVLRERKKSEFQLKYHYVRLAGKLLHSFNTITLGPLWALLLWVYKLTRIDMKSMTRLNVPSSQYTFRKSTYISVSKDC